MATYNVPIEIVLQDPSDPIVPDTSDTTSGGSSTSAPNTAVGEGITTSTISKADSQGGINEGSSASIATVGIIAAIIVGAVLCYVAYILKKKKAKTASRVVAATSTIAVLTMAILLGQLALQPIATNAATEGTILNTPDKIQIIANRYEDVTIVASTKAISYATTDTTFGYKIFMSMAGDNANLYLNGDTDSQYYFAPTNKLGLSANSWGYSLNGDEEYYAMSLIDDPIMANQNTSAASNKEIDIYYTMKAGKDMPFGVYSGEIAYKIEGYNSFPSTLTTMQGMTSEICNAVYTPNAFKADGVTIEDDVPTATLTDTRDDKTYRVAKLADGKCWMVQNLDLQKEDLKQGVVLDSTNTDNPATNFTLPASQTSGNDKWALGSPSSPNSGPVQADIETTHVYDTAASGTIYKKCLKSTYECVEYGDDIPLEELGNLYNWYTATAGTGTYNVGNNGREKATGSICPANWELPNSSNDKEVVIDYGNLLYVYGFTDTPYELGDYYDRGNFKNIYKAPLYLVPAGYYGGGLYSVGSRGHIHSSLAYHTNGIVDFTFGASFAYINDHTSKVAGYSVRCVAR